MKLKLFTLLLLSTFSFSQIKFEKGYIIKENGTKITCLIKNMGWKNNPVEITYKLSDESESQELAMNQLKEFSIGESILYTKYTVAIDKSSVKLDLLSKSKYPEFVEETLLLKQLVKGKANLFLYRKGDMIKYFFSKNSENEVRQLVYKEYLLANNVDIAKNETFKQQLFNQVNCNNTPISYFNSLSYKENSLVKAFRQFNACNGEEVTKIKERAKYDWFNLRVIAGVKFSSMSVQSPSGNLNTDFDSELGLDVGIDLEFVLPFNKNKWSLFTGAYYDQYNTSKSNNNFTAELKQTILQIPLGLRYRMFINDDNNIFLGAAYNVNILLDSELKYDVSSPISSDSAGGNIVFDVGYELKSKYYIGAKVNTETNTFKDFVNRDSEYIKYSLVVGYKIL